MEQLRRIEFRLRADHPLFDLPPKPRGQRARELVEAGTEITQIKQEIAQIKQMFEAISLKIDQIRAAPTQTVTSVVEPEKKGVGSEINGQFDTNVFLESFK